MSPLLTDVLSFAAVAGLMTIVPGLDTAMVLRSAAANGRRHGFATALLAEGTLLLRPWRQEDVAVLLAAGRDPVISRYRYSLPRAPDAVHEWIALTESDREDDKRLELALAVGGEPVGSVSLTDFEYGNAMVRYWLLPEGRGRGLATTGVLLLAGWGFSALAIGRLAAYVESDNTASGAVLERCGFVCEGRLRQHMPDHDGKRVDTLLYGLLPADLRV